MAKITNLQLKGQRMLDDGSIVYLAHFETADGTEFEVASDQASDVKLTGYAMGSTTTAISPNDSLLVAMQKLEARVHALEIA